MTRTELEALIDRVVDELAEATGNTVSGRVFKDGSFIISTINGVFIQGECDIEPN